VTVFARSLCSMPPLLCAHILRVAGETAKLLDQSAALPQS